MRGLICGFLSLLMAIPAYSNYGQQLALFEPATNVSNIVYPRKATARASILGVKDAGFMTLAPDVEVFGPHFPIDPKEDWDLAQKYVQWTFREIIRRAHGFIHDKGEFGFDPTSNENWSYWSFLILSLAVPHHESNLNHFRDGNSELCIPKANRFARISRGSRAVMLPIYRDDLEPLVPNCEDLPSDAKMTRLNLSYDHEDVGIMMVNPRWHALAMEPHILLNTRNFIQYGVEYLFDGYLQVRANLDANPNHYGCEMKYDPFKASNTVPRIFYNMKRAVWAGKYNSKDRMCRFTDEGFRLEGHDVNPDVGFKKSLDKIIQGFTSIYHAYLPEDSLEMQALNEITNNYFNIYVRGTQPEQTANLYLLLSLPEFLHQNWAPPGRTREALATHTLEQAKIKTYSRPSALDELVCGTLDTRNFPGSRIRVTGTQTRRQVGRGEVKWAQVYLTKYALRFREHGDRSYVQLRKGKNFVNLRSIPGSRAEETKIGIMKPDSDRKYEFIAEIDLDGVFWLAMRDETDRTYYAHGDYVERVALPIEAPDDCNREELYIEARHLRNLPVEFQQGRSYLAEVTGDESLTVRMGPGTRFDAVGSLAVGDEIQIIGDNAKKNNDPSWFKVRWNDTREAWVHANYVQLLRDLTAEIW